MTDLTQLSIDGVIEALNERGTRRAYLVWDPKTQAVLASHAFLEELAKEVGNDPVDFDRHEGLFFEVGRDSGALLGAFVHRTVRGQAAGGVRFWDYRTFGEYLRDGIRLAKGMTHKNALAGLWWGGGKGVIARPSGVPRRDPKMRKKLYADFGRFITSLRGAYVTAEDVGTNTEDMAWVFAETRFTTCIPESVGGSGNPSVPTARGVVVAIEAALDQLGLGELSGKRVAIQGIGNVGLPLAKLLLERGVDRVIASDIDPQRIDGAREELGDEKLELRLVQPEDQSILFEDVAVISPCATGAVLSSETIPKIRAKIVCGAANNQLRVPDSDGSLLVQHGITYVPDFLANRMGIVNCADEQYGYLPDDQSFERHLGKEWEQGIYQLTKRVLSESTAGGVPTDRTAVRIAEELSSVPHPIWGHRGAKIIEGLVEDSWERG